MLKHLIEVTNPTTLEIANQIKQDLEEKGCKVYLTRIPYKSNMKNQEEIYVIWREPDEEDRKDGLKIKKVDIEPIQIK